MCSSVLHQLESNTVQFQFQWNSSMPTMTINRTTSAIPACQQAKIAESCHNCLIEIYAYHVTPIKMRIILSMVVTCDCNTDRCHLGQWHQLDLFQSIQFLSGSSSSCLWKMGSIIIRCQQVVITSQEWLVGS